MKVLFDTNVILDALLEREPFVTPAVLLLAKVEMGDLQGYLCATSITTIFYLAARVKGRSTATQMIESLLRLFEVAPVNRFVLEEALQGESSDFEDAVLYASAELVGVDAVVTRDRKGFESAKMPVFSPVELLGVLRSLE